MTFTSTITSKGQVTIPQRLREISGFKTGNKISFYKKDNKIILEVVPDFLSLGGLFKTKKKMPDLKKLRKKIQEQLARNIIAEIQ